MSDYNAPLEMLVFQILDQKLPFQLLSNQSALELANLLLFHQESPYQVIPKMAEKLAAPELASVVICLPALLYLMERRGPLPADDRDFFQQKVGAVASTFAQTPKVQKYMSRAGELSDSQVRSLLDAYFPVFEKHFHADRSAVRNYQKDHPNLFSPAVDYKLGEMALNAFTDQHWDAEELLMDVRTDLFFTGYKK